MGCFSLADGMTVLVVFCLSVPSLFIKNGTVKNNRSDREQVAQAGIRVNKALSVVYLEWSKSWCRAIQMFSREKARDDLNVICCAVSRAREAASKYTSLLGFSRKGRREWFIMSKTCIASWRSKIGIRADFHSGEFIWILEMIWDADLLAICSLLQLTPLFSVTARLESVAGNCKSQELNAL